MVGQGIDDELDVRSCGLLVQPRHCRTDIAEVDVVQQVKKTGGSPENVWSF